jgi:glycosyltransferase involved in cell wall biosynthesis
MKYMENPHFTTKDIVSQDQVPAKLQTCAPLRIALVAQWGDRMRPPGGGSVALCTRYFARALTARGCSVRIYGVEWDGDRDSAFRHADVDFRLLRPTLSDRLLFRAFRKTRRLHRVLNGGRPIPDWRTRAAGPSWRARIAEDLARDPVDLVLCQHGARSVASIKRRLPDLPVILHLHAVSVPQAMSASYRACMMQADAVSGVSPFVADDAQRLLGRPVHVIRNGCDLSDMDSAAAAPVPGPVRILYAGAVSPEKGVHVLVEAFDMLCREGRDVALNIIGQIGARPVENVIPMVDNPRQRTLEALFAGDYGAHLRGLLGKEARARTVFFGQRPHGEVLAAMAQSDVFAFPSLCDEGFGLPPVEALAMGCVPVVSDRGPLPWIVEQTAGLVVPHDNPRALAAAIARVIDDPDLRAGMATTGRALSRTVFSWDAAAGDLLDIAVQLGLRPVQVKVS